MRRKMDRNRTDRDPATRLSPSRRRLFTLVMVLVPVVALVSTELVLRALEYGGETGLVVRRTFGGTEYYAINRSVGRRYFAHSGTMIPEPAEDVFEIRKPPGTLRIFTLGESTMAGFPYEFHVTAPSFLRDRLQAMLPEKKIEAVNVGLSAVGSYVTLDFLKDLLEYEPDLFILYVGHNEFYGAYGVGSTVRAPGGHMVTKIAITLLRFRTFLLVRDLVAGALALVRPQPSTPTGTLMEQVVAEQEIPYGSPLYLRAREIYRSNLESILETARAHGVPILVSTLVSNIRTQPPFSSAFADGATEELREEWQAAVAAGDSLLAQGRPVEAAERFSSAVRLDSANAGGFFRLGQALYAAGETAAARDALMRAKDLDLLRFRISEDFQADLRAVCAGTGAPVARVDSAFELASPHGIVGSELMLEHLHPTIGGYFLMARTWCTALRDHGLLVPRDAWSDAPEPSDSSLMIESTASEFDTLLGVIKIDRLIRRWPFTHNNSPPPPFVPRTEQERIVWGYVQGKVKWSEARYRLADYYSGRKEYGRARREALALWKASPFSYEPLLRVADYYALEGRTREAEAAYLRSIRTEDNPFARMKLSILLINGGRPREAIGQIDTALSIERLRPRMDRASLSTARYFLAVASAAVGDITRAREEAEAALNIDRGNRAAREFLNQLPK